MKLTRTLAAHTLVAGAAVGVVTFQNAAEEAPKPASVRHSVVTQVVTLKVNNAHGEPLATSAVAKFDRDIESYWVSVVGQDVKFTHSTEKQINRVLFAVDPFGKVMNNRDIEISGKLGIKDGSGNWDDHYEGTITVAVTAILADQ